MRLCIFPWNRNWNLWLMTIRIMVFRLTAFCRVVLARCIVLAFKIDHSNGHHSRKKFWWNRSEEWLDNLEVAMGKKKDRRWKHRSVYSKNVKLCVMILSFSVCFWSEIKAPDCTDLHLDFNIFRGAPPDHPAIGLTFCFWAFTQSHPWIFFIVHESDECKYGILNEWSS